MRKRQILDKKSWLISNLSRQFHVQLQNAVAFPPALLLGSFQLNSTWREHTVIGLKIASAAQDGAQSSIDRMDLNDFAGKSLLLSAFKKNEPAQLGHARLGE